MNARIRYTLAASVVTLTGCALYACSSDENVPGTDSGADTATSEGGADGGTDTSTDNNVVETSAKTCPFIEDGGGRAPLLEPPACKACASERCCTQITKCDGAPAADGGYDGGDDTKSLCVLFGECETRCVGAPNVPQCEFDCSQHYGAGAVNDWGGREGCIYGTAPAGCKEFCP